MKKIIAMLLAVMMVLAMAACAPADKGTSGESKDPCTQNTEAQGGEATQASEVRNWNSREIDNHQGGRY